MTSFAVKPAGSALTLNQDNDRHYVVEKSEADGLEDIRKLAAAAGSTAKEEVEEEWLFVEGVDKAKRKRSFWFEIGFEEQKNHVEVDVTYLETAREFLRSRDIQIQKGTLFHYHPLPEVKPGTLQWGIHYPSLGDVTGIPNSQYNWETLEFGGLFFNGVVTARGVWRNRWKGPTLTSVSFDSPRYKNKLEHHAKKAWAYIETFKGKCRGDLETVKKCPHISGAAYGDFAKIYSNDWAELVYEPFPSRGGGVLSRPKNLKPFTASHFAAITHSDHSEFFQMISDQLAEDSEEMEGEALKIKLTDPETGFRLEISPNGDRRVQFRYAIDTNPDPSDGRIYFTDSFTFDREGKYQAQKFTRLFDYKRDIPLSGQLKKWADKYAALRDPSLENQKSFAEHAVRQVL